MKLRRRALALLLAAGALALVAAGCGRREAKQVELSGEIKIDGSSTVFPISEAVAEEFQKANPGVRVTVGISGTGGGFKKFVAGEIDISDASRPIKDSEKEKAAANGIDYIELPVAYDGISVVVNPAATWVDYLTTAELKAIWDQGSTVNNWSQVRAGFPDQPLALFGPGTDSGTFDYFTGEINGEERRSRSDYQASEDDNTLVTGVAGQPGALGYFGFAYYEANADKLKLVPIDGGKGPVAPSLETIRSGEYSPLSRPIYIYVNKKALERPEVKAFVEFYLKQAPNLVKDVGYVPLPQEQYDEGLNKIGAR